MKTEVVVDGCGVQSKVGGMSAKSRGNVSHSSQSVQSSQLPVGQAGRSEGLVWGMGLGALGGSMGCFDWLATVGQSRQAAS